MTIQRLFAKKKLLESYNKFRQTLAHTGDKDGKKLIKIQNIHYHVLTNKDEKNSQHKILLWNINNYKLETIDYTPYSMEDTQNNQDVVDVRLKF